MVRIRRFSVLRTATVAAVMYFLVTLLFMLPIALILSAAPSIPTAPGTQTFDPDAMGGAAILVLVIVLPLVYALFGWIITAVACLLYNLVAAMTGGIEMQLVQLVPPPASTAWQQPASTTQQSGWGAPQG